MAKLKLLIAEHALDIQEIYNRVLSDEIFEKKFVDNGRDTLTEFSSYVPDILLLDVYMPVMTGYMVLKEIRENIGDTSTTIIMQTSITNKDQILQFIKLGIQGYIVKPFDPETVANRILEYYKAKDAQRAAVLQANLNALRTG